MDLETAKEIYFHELNAKAEQDRRLGIFVALFSAVGGVLAFLVGAVWPPRSCAHTVALTLVIAAVVLYFCAIERVLRTTIGFKYQKLVRPAALLSYSDGLQRFYRENPSPEVTADAEFTSFVIKRLMEAADWNEALNISRSERFYQAARYLVWVVVLCSVAGLPLVVSEVL